MFAACRFSGEVIMRFLPTRLHGVLDYVVGLIVIALPIAFALQGAALLALVGLGAFAIGYSLLTDYELGVVRFLRVRFHLCLDSAFGIAMLLTPTIIGLPPALHLLVYAIGILAIILAGITKIRATGTAS
jgi:hypothetical protein